MRASLRYQADSTRGFVAVELPLTRTLTLPSTAWVSFVTVLNPQIWPPNLQTPTPTKFRA